jgi:hypothetical protein
MASSTRPQRRFAPLGQPATEGAPQLQGIVFDMDGTLCKYPFSISENKKWCMETGNREREKKRKKDHDTPYYTKNTLPSITNTTIPTNKTSIRSPSSPQKKKKNFHPPNLSIRT